MFSSKTCRFALFSFLSLSANAENIRGAHRELHDNASVNLGDAGSYAILSKLGITNTGASAITGDIGVSPYAATAITGFSLTQVTGEFFSTSDVVTGEVYAASYGGATAIALTAAIGAIETPTDPASGMMGAYEDAEGRATSVDEDGVDRVGWNNAGTSSNPLTEGVYTFGTYVTINEDIYFDGSSTDIFIIQIAGYLQVNNDVILSGGALASNIFWQVATSVSVGGSAHMQGIILAGTAVTFVTNASLNGRIYAKTAVTLDSNDITEA
jgi:hypothetical protein